MECDEPPSPSPCPRPPPSSLLLKDISNFKTPKRPPQTPVFKSPCPEQFFTASKQTPKSYARSLHRHGLSKSKSKTAAARKLKSLEMEQSKSAYKSKLKKEQSLKSLSKSLTVWLNFLIQNPQLCGYDRIGTDLVVAKGKREGGEIMTWRNPKRPRDMWWKGENDNVDVDVDLVESKYLLLKNSLKDVCSLDDLKQRMSLYLSLGGCKEVFHVMTLVIKNIDDGRLKMKSHCPIVTDVGMKEKATSVIMSYNPIWLRIGLYIIFGGDSLLLNEDINYEQEMVFLKMIIEKQFFSHAGLAKVYAYNKKVEGLYRPGYFESLGTVILKRFLLLVLILDRAKSQGILPLKYGIDGVDGGSPLLFLVKSSIKSSRQVIVDFLSSDVMHGEGSLLAHLAIVGYKVSYQQSPLVEYDFRVKDLFVDLQDGLRLGRIIQLLLQDSSILTKLLVPSDTRKKNLTNCGIALQYLRKAGVMLYDDDGTPIMEDDVVNGDKELILSLLWNMFVHLQLPLLINKNVLDEEIYKLQGTSVDKLNCSGSTLDLLLNWIQVVCQKYDYQIDNFSSLTDGKAIWCLLDFYFRKEISSSYSSKECLETRGEESIMSATDYTDAFHNFILSQKLTTLLGSFPEVLQMSDILEHNGACSDRSVVILLVFLASQLIVRKNMGQLNFHKLLGCKCQNFEKRRSNIGYWILNSEALSEQHEEKDDSNEDAARKFKALQAWWQEMAEKNNRSASKPPISALQSFSTSKNNINLDKGTTIVQAAEGIAKQSKADGKLQGNAAQVIQSHFRRWIQRRNFLKMRNAVSFVQIAIRAWLEVKFNSTLEEFNTKNVKHFEIGRYVKFIVEKHGFGKLKRSVLLIQRATRTWISHRHQVESMDNQGVSTPYLLSGARDVQTCVPSILEIEKTALMCQEKDDRELETEAALKIQLAWGNFSSNKSLHKKCVAATKVQSHFRGWQLRQRFLILKQATIKIQSHFRCLSCQRTYQEIKFITRSAIFVQSCIRGWLARRQASRVRCFIVNIQRYFRGWLIRRDFMVQRKALVKIQSAIRCLLCRRSFHLNKSAAIDIQRFVRGQITRRRLLGSSWHLATTFSGNYNTLRDGFQNFELGVLVSSVSKLQRWWRHVLLLKLKRKSVTIIQSHIRGWAARKKLSREKHCVVVIQSCWKGYLARKESSRQMQDLCMRVQNSATNVDDGMRIINRLVSALSELLNMKSLTGILQTCATLDMTTRHSQKCCEKLVAAGAIDTLLELIRSVSRSIPDQEVLKHALSTLKNLTRYPHLIEELIDSRGSVETILWEMLRNKDEGYFIASEILKKICSNHKGVEAISKLHGHVKRLNTLVEELTRKANMEKRNARSQSVRANLERRLREAVELVKLIKQG